MVINKKRFTEKCFGEPKMVFFCSNAIEEPFWVPILFVLSVKNILIIGRIFFHHKEKDGKVPWMYSKMIFMEP